MQLPEPHILRPNAFVFAFNKLGNCLSMAAGNLGPHMVKQLNSFNSFLSSKSSDEKTAESVQRVLTGSLAALSFIGTANSLCKSMTALSQGRVIDSVGNLIKGTGYAVATCALTSLTLNPVGFVRAFKQ